MRAATLARLTLAYLALPQFLFLPCWLGHWVGIPAALLLLSALIVVWRTLASPPGLEKFDSSLGWAAIVSALVLACLLTLVSGASGLVHQTWDWEKHDAVLSDLARNPWPVVYEFSEEHRYYLMYYFGYYLPAAGMAKFAGAFAGQVMLFVWTATGAALGLCWVALMVGLRFAVCIWIFPLLGGLDLVGHLILRGGFPLWHQNLEVWLRGYVNFSNLVLFVWSPQHALAVWLGVPLVIFATAHPRLLVIAAFTWALVLFWSPLVAVGLAALLVWRLTRIRSIKRACSPWENALLVPAVAAILLVAIEGLFLMNGVARIPLAWLWQAEPLPAFLPKLVLFYLVEFGAYWLLVPRQMLGREQRSLLIFGVITLVTSPWIRFGIYNDLAARLAHVAQYLVWLAVLTSLANFSKRSVRLWLLAAALAIGVAPALAQLRFILRVTALYPASERAAISVPHLQPIAAAAQYLGRTDARAWKIIAPDTLHFARVRPLPGAEPHGFESPFLLFNFRGQGVERDESGWWMWNRGDLEFSFLINRRAMKPASAKVLIRFEQMAADQDQPLVLHIATAHPPVDLPLTAHPGAWSTTALDPVTLSGPDVTLTFSLANPATGIHADPRTREFAIKNIRFEIVPSE
jgi:hypothetical protein